MRSTYTRPRPWQETLVVARDRRKWRRARYSRANTSKRKGRKAVLSKTDHPVRRTTGRDHRKVAQLHPAYQ